MKKSKFLVALIAVMTVAFSVIAFAACGNNEEETTPVTIEKTYVCGDLVANNTSGHDSIVYQVHFLSDGSYELTKTTLVYGYSMNLGTYSVQSYGTFTKGASEDGYTSYTLGKATHVILNAYSLAGGFNISIDTATTQYPVEMPAAAEGEKPMANSADDVINAYGAEMKIYVSDTKNTFSLTNPNA